MNDDRNDDQHHEELDDLDRALFALPLETPPAGLHAAILNSTVYAATPRTVASLARPWEFWACGAALAVAAWLVVSIVAVPAFAAAFRYEILSVVRALSEPGTLSWFAVGFFLAAAIWYLGGTSPRLPSRGART